MGASRVDGFYARVGLLGGMASVLSASDNLAGTGCGLLPTLCATVCSSCAGLRKAAAACGSYRTLLLVLEVVWRTCCRELVGFLDSTYGSDATMT